MNNIITANSKIATNMIPTISIIIMDCCFSIISMKGKKTLNANNVKMSKYEHIDFFLMTSFKQMRLKNSVNTIYKRCRFYF